MQTALINKSDSEKILLVVKNVDGGGSITTGLGVALVVTGASIDGISSVRHTAANAKGFVGISQQDIPINAFGLVQCWGATNSILLSNVGTSITITRGDVLIPGAVAGTFFSSVTDQGLSTLLYKYVINAQTQTISAAAYVSGVVRAL